MLGLPLPHPLYGLTGMALLMLFGYLAERSLNEWREKAGHAPYRLGRRSTPEERNRFMREVPTGVRHRMRLFQGIGMALAIVGAVLASR